MDKRYLIAAALCLASSSAIQAASAATNTSLSVQQQKGNVVEGTIARMTEFGAFVQLEDGIDALLHVSQISRDRIEKPSDALSIGQEIEAKVVDLNEADKKISLSIKALLNDNEAQEEAPATEE